MKTLHAGLAGLATLLLAASSAQAQPPAAPEAAAGADDINCLIVGTVMTQSTDANMKAAAPLVAFYYLGRIDAMNPKIDLQKAIADARPKVVADLQKVGSACTQVFSARFNALNTIGQAQGAVPAPAPAAPPAP